MWAWRLSRWLTTAAPLIFLAGVSVSGRSSAPPEPARPDYHVAHDRLLAYVPVVRATERLGHLPPKEREKELDRVVDQWISLANRGELRTVYSFDFGSGNLESIDSDIKLSKLILLNALASRVNSATAKRDVDKEATTLATMVHLSTIDKYSTFLMVHHFASLQTKHVDRLSKLLPSLSIDTREEVRKMLLASTKIEDEMAGIADHAKKQHAAFLAASEKTPLPIEMANNYVTLARVSESPTSQALADLRRAARYSTDGEFIKIGSACRVSAKSERAYQQKLAVLLRSLQSTK